MPEESRAKAGSETGVSSLVAGGFGPAAAACSASLQQYQRQRQSSERAAMALAAAYRVLEQRKTLEVAPAKTGYAELCGRAILANHRVLKYLRKGQQRPFISKRCVQQQRLPKPLSL